MFLYEVDQHRSHEDPCPNRNRCFDHCAGEESAVEQVTQPIIDAGCNRIAGQVVTATRIPCMGRERSDGPREHRRQIEQGDVFALAGQRSIVLEEVIGQVDAVQNGQVPTTVSQVAGQRTGAGTEPIDDGADLTVDPVNVVGVIVTVQEAIGVRRKLDNLCTADDRPLTSSSTATTWSCNSRSTHCSVCGGGGEEDQDVGTQSTNSASPASPSVTASCTRRRRDRARFRPTLHPCFRRVARFVTSRLATCALRSSNHLRCAHIGRCNAR